MLYNLTEATQSWLDDRGLSWVVMVMYQLEFRALFAALLSFVLVLTFGPRVIRWLAQRKIGDTPEFGNDSLNQLMQSRAGTPTMGGVIICGALIASTLLLADVIHNRYIHLGLMVVISFGVLGSVDDWLKLTQSRRSPGVRDGLFAWEKLLFQLGLSLIIGFFLYRWGSTVDAHVLNLPFQRTYLPTPSIESIIQPPPIADGVWILGIGFFLIVAMLAIAGTSNAVNMTDGMDGLATGTLIIASLAMMVLIWIAGSPRAAYFLMVPSVAGTGELMVMAGAMAGACLGFLWFNCSPARIFMGDTGSLALGALLGFFAVAVRQELLLLLIGGIFFLELGSVFAQRTWFRWTRKRYGQGRRIFRCAPIHHHFHLGGWKEQQVVVRFWLISVVLTMIALVSLKLR
ncbi:MAG: phospho-N-acetylmuramoyl-pentapeptide-transferase [Planctomycetota bacterium]|nr:phospho-N-acetylmuramoyl-pentapeptide-transferase [Planctomycetota bacterium]MDA1262809.1 phospho-N-acetylmuramoyl-pentapeptide-transferase [Planctomycetota bacterium]